MVQRGFTIVELLVVIAIMGILLVLGVVGLRGTQVDARDTERRTDVEAIATQLESFYSVGANGSALGQYPSTQMIGSEDDVIPNIDPKSLQSPGQETSSLVAATCSGACVQTTAGVNPQPTINQYVYQPIRTDGTLCSNTVQECRKFNLYYRDEKTNTIHKITSRHQ